MTQLYNGMDLSEWDPRSYDLVVKHGLERSRFERILRRCDGDSSRVELYYLRHLGQELYSDSIDEREGVHDKNGTTYPIVLNLKREAKRIFELYEELVEKHPTMENYALREQMKGWVRGIDLWLEHF